VGICKWIILTWYQVSSRLITILKLIYVSGIFVLTFYFSVIKFLSHVIPSFVSESYTGYISYISQFIFICLAWILQQLPFSLPRLI